MTKEQEAVARGTATDDQRAKAKKQKRYVVLKRPYYPTLEDVKEAMNWLADRGFGKAPQTVTIEGDQTTGFKMVFRRWAPGTDPVSMGEMPRSIVAGEKMLGPKPRTPGANGTNGHHNGSNGH